MESIKGVEVILVEKQHRSDYFGIISQLSKVQND